MKILSPIFIILLSFISCRTTKTSQPKVLLASTTAYETIKIASFNIQIFGKTKAGKPEERVQHQVLPIFNVIEAPAPNDDVEEAEVVDGEKFSLNGAASTPTQPLLLICLIYWTSYGIE